MTNRILLLGVFSGLMAVALVGGCARLTPPPPEMPPLRVTGRGAAPVLDSESEQSARANSSTNRPDWVSQTLEARVDVPLPAGANSHIEAAMVARRQACDDALRQIAQRALELPAHDGLDVRGVIRLDDTVGPRVEQAIRSETVLTTPEALASATYSVVARLELRAVALAIWGQDALDDAKAESQKSAEEQALPLEAAQRLALERATADARRQLLERVEHELLMPNCTVGEHIRANPQAKAEVDAAVQSAPIVETTYPQPGVCEAVASLDIKGLVRQLRQ